MSNIRSLVWTHLHLHVNDNYTRSCVKILWHYIYWYTVGGIPLQDRSEMVAWGREEQTTWKCQAGRWDTQSRWPPLLCCAVRAVPNWLLCCAETRFSKRDWLKYLFALRQLEKSASLRKKNTSLLHARCERTRNKRTALRKNSLTC